MPLQKAVNRSKKARNKAVSANIHELVHNGKIHRSMKQIIAIAIKAAGATKKRMDVMDRMRNKMKKQK